MKKILNILSIKHVLGTETKFERLNDPLNLCSNSEDSSDNLKLWTRLPSGRPVKCLIKIRWNRDILKPIWN